MTKAVEVDQAQSPLPAQPAIAVPVEVPSAPTTDCLTVKEGVMSDSASSTICLEIPHPRGTIKVNWPTESAAACATFLRDLLR